MAGPGISKKLSPVRKFSARLLSETPAALPVDAVLSSASQDLLDRDRLIGVRCATHESLERASFRIWRRTVMRYTALRSESFGCCNPGVASAVSAPAILPHP